MISDSEGQKRSPQSPLGLCLCGRAHAFVRTASRAPAEWAIPSHALYGRRDGKRFSIYVPDELVPEIRDAIANGRRVQELVAEAGVRYAQALKANAGRSLTDEETDRGVDHAMLSEQDFAAWANRLKLSEPAQSVIARVRCSDPARRVGGGRLNVAGRYPSKKMGNTIQFESHRVELPAIVELEYDDTVLEYYDQPPSIKLDYRSADGKRLGVLHTPDFFVIRTSRAGWEECKTEEELTRLSERNPNRYCRDVQVSICPPGQQYAEGFGLYYRVRSSAGINWHFQRNIQFLEDYLRTAPQVPSVHRLQVMACVAAQPACSLEDLFHATDGEVTRDEIYALIATGDIFVDLLSAALPESETVKVWLKKPPRPDAVDFASPSPPSTQIQQRLLHASVVSSK